MNLADRIHRHLSENKSHCSFELELLAFIFPGDDEHEIERACRQLEREGRAVRDEHGWKVGLVEEVAKGPKQGALFV